MKLFDRTIKQAEVDITTTL